jgi:pimeloyl-ACP methyl ester carboxylesterase
MDSASFGRMRVHWREHGAGEPLLLVHGLMTSSYSWRYVAGELGRRFRLVIPDLPGCGATDKPRGARYDAASLAAWIGEFSRAVGVRGCRAIGNSLGGFLCMRLALDDPGAFSRLVNVHSPAAPELRYTALRGALAMPGVPSALVGWIRKDPLRWAHRNVHYHDESLKSLEEARAYGEPLGSEEGARAFVGYLRDAVAGGRFADFLGRLQQGFPIPLLLVYARTDPMVNPKNGVLLSALLPAAEIVWLEDSSHFAHVDSPDRFLAAISGFLDGSAPRAK